MVGREPSEGSRCLVEDLAHALTLLASQPEIGARAQNTKLGVRRIHLARVHYYLYYRVSDSPPGIEVLALWHSSRGSVPPV
jgi:plasmid stabilization system protein ParE